MREKKKVWWRGEKALPLSEPLAYLLTWTTYGTWLHGDDRGWVESGNPGIRPPNPERRKTARRRMIEEEVTLDAAQREIIEATIRTHCQLRRWVLHAVNVRTNHVLVVLTADVHPDMVMKQLKAWCSRRLREHAGLAAPATLYRNGLRRWWTEHGSTRWINDEEYLQNAIRYVFEGQ